MLVQSALESEGRTKATIPAAALTVVSSFAVVALSSYEQTHSIRPSILLEIYLFLTLLFDAVRVRTLWLINADHTTTVMLTSSVAVKVVVLALEAFNKHVSSIESTPRSIEEISGAFSLAFFSWLIPLINTGYRKVLSLADLYPLAKDMQSDNVGARFDVYWMRSKYRIPHHPHNSYDG